MKGFKGVLAGIMIFAVALLFLISLFQWIEIKTDSALARQSGGEVIHLKPGSKLYERMKEAGAFLEN